MGIFNEYNTAKGMDDIFPQFDKFYPYVSRSTNSLSYNLVWPNKAHIFTNEAAVKRVLRIYQNFYPTKTINVRDIGTNDTEWTKHQCISNSVANFEISYLGRNNLMPYNMYNSTKSVVPDPYNAPLEVRLIEFEIDVPTK